MCPATGCIKIALFNMLYDIFHVQSVELTANYCSILVHKLT